MWKNQTLKRQELCLSCLECCKWIEISTTYPDTVEIREFFTVRGWKVVTRGKVLHIYTYHPCPHLTDRGCDMYETRPIVCRMYNGLADNQILEYTCKWGIHENNT